MAKRITIADVAREVGVSMMTVSRVINNKGEVSEETAQRILEAIDELGYRPSGIARGLASKRTLTIGLVVPDVGNTFFSDVARGVEQTAYANGYNVFLCNTDEDPQRESAVLNSLEEKRIDGLVLCSSRLDDTRLSELLSRFPAVVLVNRSLPGYDGKLVQIDDVAGAKSAVHHLLGSGHESIGFLAGPEVSESGKKRLSGYRSALGKKGIAFNPELVLNCFPNVESAQERASILLNSHPDLTALFCYNDLVAVGALKAATEFNKNVPNDLAVVGFDDIPLAELVTPSLTTCRVPRHDLGVRAIESLLDQMNDCDSDCSDIILQPELIVRRSAP
jgi:LacI family transcriptional regulator